MNRLSVLLIPMILFLLFPSANAGLWGKSVTFNDLHDQRTFSSPDFNPPSSEGGLGGYWPYSFAIEWEITYDDNAMLWNYEYTLSATHKEVSHFILELTIGTTQNDFTNLLINGNPATFDDESEDEIEGPKYWGQHSGNPNYPTTTDIYGIKFDVGGNPVTYSLTTANDPVWGNFYTKDGKDHGNWIYAYNNALAINGFDSNDKLDFIVRPDGGDNPPVVPEPVSSLLFVTGGVTVGFRRFLKK